MPTRSPLANQSKTRSVTKVIDRIRHDIQQRLEQLLPEADNLHRAHAVIDPGHVHAVGYDTEQLANTGNTIGGTRLFGGSNSGSENSDLAFTGISIAAAGAVPGTNAPYLQLVACRKN